MCSLEKGTRWVPLGRTRDNAQCCSSINKKLVICHFVGEKNQASVGREMHGRGMCRHKHRGGKGSAAFQFSDQSQGGTQLLALVP